MKNLVIVGALLIVLTSCKMADVRTKYMIESPAEDDYQKGRTLLEISMKAMGYGEFSNVQSYEATALFDWKFPWSGMLLNSLLGARGNKVQFKFRPISFDGRVEYLEDRKKGDVHGLQSWRTYELEQGKPVTKKDKRRGWGLAAFHYMLEAPYRLLNADVIRYAGSNSFEGRDYDMVFVSWHRAEPHKEHDQWLLYINKETKFVDMSNLTIRDFFLRFPPNMAEGTVHYLHRTKKSSSIYLPDNLVIQLLNPKKETKYVYRITFSDYKFNSFDIDELSPIQDLPVYGDEKPVTLE